LNQQNLKMWVKWIDMFGPFWKLERKFKKLLMASKTNSKIYLS